MEDPRFGLPTVTCKIPEEFGKDKVLAIKKLSIIFGIIAVIFSFLGGVGVYDLLTTGLANRTSVILLILIAFAGWGFVALLWGGGMSSREAGMRSEIRVYQNGFVLVQGKRFGGEKKDACLWEEIQSVSAKRMGRFFLGYSVIKKDGSKIFLSANFEGLDRLKPLVDRVPSSTTEAS